MRQHLQQNISSNEALLDVITEKVKVDIEMNSYITNAHLTEHKSNSQERNWIKWAMLVVDIISLELSLCFGITAFQYFFPDLNRAIDSTHYLSLSIGMVLVPIGYWLVRLYPGYGFTAVERMRRRIRATSVFMLLFFCWVLLFSHNKGMPAILLLTLGFSLLIPPVIQNFFRSFLIRLNLWGSPVLVLGAAKTGEYVLKTLIKNPIMGLRPVAAFDDDPQKAGKIISGVPVYHGLFRANELSEKVKYALLAIPGAGRELQIEIVTQLKFRHVIIIPDLIGLQSLWVEARDMGGIVGLEIRKNLLIRRNWLIKRWMDYFLGTLFFIISIPIITFFASWVMIVSSGNPFYCQVREGRGGKKFKVWKMRTMHPKADKLLNYYFEKNPDAKLEWNKYFKLKNDPRIIKGVGHLLRKTSLDELPQLWNVLRGEMSLVGPRPFPHYHLEQFDDSFRKLRMSVLPGMTGLWQVEARSDGDLDVQESLDTYYIRNWSIWLDLNILIRTIMVVFSCKGAY